MTRRQLSLYVPADASAEIELVREVLDPIQHKLIPAHVTLCREHELRQIPLLELRRRFAAAERTPITLQFGRPEVFCGHGVLLNCIRGEGDFHALRACLLDSNDARPQRPHITLAHPRNPISPGNSLANASGLHEAISITFPTVLLIEQQGGEPWRPLETFELAGSMR